MDYTDYGAETINGRPAAKHITVWLQVRGRRLRLRPIGYAPALSVTHSAAAVAVSGLWRYISVIHLPSTYRKERKVDLYSAYRQYLDH